MKTNLSKFDNSWYAPGASKVKMILWYFINILFFQNPLNPFSFIKVILLRVFGARVGRKVRIKPSVNIKYPWRLFLGNNVWIGENVWIDNLADVYIGDNVCISQGGMLLCGNHDYRSEAFDLKTAMITLEEGVWVCARATVCPGVVMHTHSVLGVGSVATKDVPPGMVCAGMPAVPVRVR